MPFSDPFSVIIIPYEEVKREECQVNPLSILEPTFSNGRHSQASEISNCPAKLLSSARRLPMRLSANVVSLATNSSPTF